MVLILNSTGLSERFLMWMQLVTGLFGVKGNVTTSGSTANKTDILMGEVVKSLKDPRSYRLVTLTNSMRCILIHSPDSDVSGASMNVQVGSLSDPPDTQGLAHFLEHMISMGSKSYPDENHFEQFLEDHAGDSNANTSFEDTNFYFEISKSSLKKGLEIFAQFFISPLFKETSLQREMQAVHSEFSKDQQDDEWRVFQVFQTTCNPGHPITHLLNGTLHTLDKPNIREELVRFFESQYSANLMTLAVYSDHKLDKLEEWVREIFSPVPNKSLPPLSLTDPAVSPSNLATLTRIVPVKKVRQLTCIWVFDSTLALYRVKPLEFISCLLEHEGKHSLFSALKAMGFATEIRTEFSVETHFMSTLDLIIELTEDGYLHYQEVLELVFCYLEVLRRRGTQDYLYAEQKLISEAEFHNEEEDEVSETVEELSWSLSRYPGTEVLTASALFMEFDPTVIQRYIDGLCLENLRVFLIAKEEKASAHLIEPWLGTKYSTEPISSELQARLRTPQLPEGIELDIPSPNTYICTNFQILPFGSAKEPTKVFEDHRSTVWYKQDHKFGMDIVLVDCYIRCSDCDYFKTAEGKILGRLWRQMLNEELAEELYPASEAGIDFEFCSWMSGFNIHISGFSQKLAIVVSLIFDKLVAFKLQDRHRKVFDRVKRELIQGLQNKDRGTPADQCTTKCNDLILHEGRYSWAEQTSVLEEVPFEKLQEFSDGWLRNLYIDWLIMGNISRDSAIGLATSVLTAFESTAPSWTNELLIGHVTQLDERPVEIATSVLCQELVSKTSKINNSAVLSLWQIAPLSFEAEGLLEVLDQFLREPFFNKLRTEEQLGYLVSTQTETVRNFLLYKFEVQSNVSCPLRLTKRISEFIDAQRKKLAKLSNNRFKTMKRSVVKNYRAKDSSLTDENERFVDEIYYRNFEFARNKLVANSVQTLTKARFIEFYEDVFYRQNRRLDIEFVGHGFEDAQADLKATVDREYVTDATSFKQKRNSGLW